MSRPPSWPNKVHADEKVIIFYKALAALQSQPELFNDCHIFDGASLNHIPFVDVLDETIPLPKHLSRFLSTKYARKICPTHGCCNPFHFQGIIDTPLKGAKPPPPILTDGPPALDAYIEAIQSVINDHDIKVPTFALIRPLIHVDDISDEFLTLSIEKLKS